MLDATEISEDLWVGGAPPPGFYSARFDTIVLVGEYQPPDGAFPGVKVRHFAFDDDTEKGPSTQDLMMAWAAATTVANDVVSGRRVLVTCRMGRNRSALVAALALHMLTGMSGKRAADIVRLKRVDAVGVRALANAHFRSFLNTIK